MLKARAVAGFGRIWGVRRMGMRLGFAICDQALFAGTSFAFTLLLGRWATQEQFGAFSVAFSVFVLLQNVFEGLVFEPLGVFGSGRLAHLLDAYIGRLVIGHVFVAGCLAAAAAVVALVMAALHQPSLAAAFLGMALATPALLARILMRQPLYITARVHWSVAIGALYLVCSLAALGLLRWLDAVTGFSAFLALGFGSLVASATVVFVLLKPVWRSADPALSPRRLIADHFGYGGWAIGERLLLWLQTNVFFLVLPAVADLHASALYRVLSTLAMPAYMTISALAGVALPTLVRRQGTSTRSPALHWIVPASMAATLFYCALLFLFGQPAAHVAFAGRYDADLTRPLLAAAGIGPVLFAAATAMEVQLRARLQVSQIVIARLAATVVLLAVGAVLMTRYAVLGATVTLAVTWAATAAAYVVLDWRRQSRRRDFAKAMANPPTR